MTFHLFLWYFAHKRWQRCQNLVTIISVMFLQQNSTECWLSRLSSVCTNSEEINYFPSRNIICHFGCIKVSFFSLQWFLRTDEFAPICSQYRCSFCGCSQYRCSVCGWYFCSCFKTLLFNSAQYIIRSVEGQDIIAVLEVEIFPQLLLLVVSTLTAGKLVTFIFSCRQSKVLLSFGPLIFFLSNCIDSAVTMET